MKVATSIGVGVVIVLIFVLVAISIWKQNHHSSSSYDFRGYAHSASNFRQHRIDEEKALSHLKRSYSTADSLRTPFDDVIVVFSGHSSRKRFIEDKMVIFPPPGAHSEAPAVVYAAGIASHPQFEEKLGEYNAEVHGFDCTISPMTQLQNNVHFHHWCLGRKSNFCDNEFSKQSVDKSFAFFSLQETMSKLQHPYVDILKMDIEGFEWNLLAEEILSHSAGTEDQKSRLPQQLLFELHTQGANPQCVPPHLTAGKTRNEVNALFLALWQLHYRVIFKMINPEDPTCADFTLLRIH